MIDITEILNLARIASSAVQPYAPLATAFASMLSGAVSIKTLCRKDHSKPPMQATRIRISERPTQLRADRQLNRRRR